MNSLTWIPVVFVLLFCSMWFWISHSENKRIEKRRQERIARGEPPDHWTDLYD